MIKKQYILCVFLLGFQLYVFGQNKRLKVEGLTAMKFNYPEIISDSLEAIEIGRELLSRHFEAGYLAASIDGSAFDAELITLKLDPGEKYNWAKLKAGNLSPNELVEIDINQRMYLQRPFNPKKLSELYERAIRYFENNGYPFVSIGLDSISILEGNNIQASLKIEKGPLYKIDSIIIKGDSKINLRYLLQSFELEPGMPYHDENIKNISRRIEEIPFLSQTRAPQVQFFEEGLKVIIHTAKKKASRFDGVLGLLTNEDDGKIELTGDVDLNLINSLNRGEHIGLNWRKLKGNSQDLQLEFQYPYLFSTPFGLDVNFKLFKRDTTFLDLTSRIGVNYTFKRGRDLRLFFENKSSQLLSRGRFTSGQVATLPALGDVSINALGVGYLFNNYNYRFNPTKGFYFDGDFSVGRKKLEKIAALEELNPNIYDDILLTTTQFNGLLQLNYFIPMGSRSTIKLGNQFASVYSENLYQNELLRIGGLKILRGFDEESINVSTYNVFTTEYRFLLDRNSFFSLFTDIGFYENNNVDGYSSDNPLGIGAGISFETNAGIFTFNYAVGRQQGNPVQFRAAKIHFGFINFF